MTLLDVKHQIKSRELLPCYIFTGEEIGIMSIYIKKIAEVANAQLMYADTVSSIVQTNAGSSILNKRKVYVIHDDTDFLKEEKVWDRFINGEALKNNILILAFYTLDKRSKFYKMYSNTIVEFTRLNSSILSVYLKREIALSDSNIEKLIEVCDNDYSRMFLEADKIKQYACFGEEHGYDVTYDEAFRDLLSDGTIRQKPYDAIFDFVDAVLRHQVRRAYTLLENCTAIGEHPLALLSVLYTNAKQVLQVQSCGDGDIAHSTGLTPWQIKVAKSKAGTYRNGDLVWLIRTIQSVESGIKSGKIDEDIAVDYVLTNIL